MRWKITAAMAALLLLLAAAPGSAYIYKEGNLGRGQRFYMDIEMNFNGSCDYMVLLAANGTLDADLYIYSPFGTKIFTMNGTSATEAQEVAFSSSGTYRFEIVSYSGSGSYLFFMGDRSEWKQVKQQR
jgi:hypothetical protein